MKVSDFNYNLPEELIAQVPLEKRDESRLMVLNREKQTIEDKTFKDIIDYLEPGDCLVRNNTKVIPARIYGKKETGAHVEFLLLNNIEGDIWESIVRPGNKLHIGTKVIFGDGLLEAEILDIMPGGTRKVEFHYNGIFNEILDQIGLMPLPPYIHEELKDNDRYQTVYAKYEGSAAAPTAGLHFTPELLKKIEEKGVKIANVTLHVGIGTFRPVKEDEVEKHEMHSEHFYIKQEDCDKINETKKWYRKVTCHDHSAKNKRVYLHHGTSGGMPSEREKSNRIYQGYAQMQRGEECADHRRFYGLRLGFPDCAGIQLQCRNHRCYL